MKTVLVLTLMLSLTLLVNLVTDANAVPINFTKCATNTDHHCYEYLPAQNTGGNITNPDWHFTAVFPQNGSPTVDGIFSDANWTAWKNNVAVMWVGNIYTTIQDPTLNFCPPAKTSLVSQNGYIGKFYNVTTGVDLTNYIYPPYCYKESGVNPINGAINVTLSSNSLPTTNGTQDFRLIFTDAQGNLTHVVYKVVITQNSTFIGETPETPCVGISKLSTTFPHAGVYTITVYIKNASNIPSFQSVAFHVNVTDISKVPEFSFVLIPLTIGITASIIVFGRRAIK